MVVLLDAPQGLDPRRIWQLVAVILARFCGFFSIVRNLEALALHSIDNFLHAGRFVPTQSQKTRTCHGVLVLNREFPARRVMPANAVVLYVQVLESQVGILEGLVGGVGARGARGFPAITGTTRTLPAEYHPEALHGEYDGQDNEQ